MVAVSSLRWLIRSLSPDLRPRPQPSFPADHAREDVLGKRQNCAGWLAWQVVPRQMTDRKTIGRAAFSSPPSRGAVGRCFAIGECGGRQRDTPGLALTGEPSLRGPGVLAWFGTKCRSSKQRTNGRRWPRPGTASLPPSLCTPYENRQISCLLPSTKLISSQLSSSYRLAGLAGLL